MKISMKNRSHDETEINPGVDIYISKLKVTSVSVRLYLYELSNT